MGLPPKDDATAEPQESAAGQASANEGDEESGGKRLAFDAAKSPESGDPENVPKKRKPPRDIDPILKWISPGEDNVAWRLLSLSLSQILLRPHMLVVLAAVIIMACFGDGFREVTFLVYPLVFVYAVRIVHHGALFGSRLRNTAFHEIFLSAPLSSKDIAKAQHRVVLLALITFLAVAEFQYFMYTSTRSLWQSRELQYWNSDRLISYGLAMSMIYAAFWCSLSGSGFRAIPYALFTTLILWTMFDFDTAQHVLHGTGAVVFAVLMATFATVLRWRYERKAVRILCDQYFA